MLRLTALRQDVRHGIRMLGKRPATTAVALLTLALALGANTAVFSVTYGVLLKALPYAEPDRVYEVALRTPPQEGRPDGRAYLDTRMVESWEEFSRTTEQVAVYELGSVRLTGELEPLRVQAAAVSPSLFPLLGVSPRHGRAFRAEDVLPGTEPVVVLGHDLWMRRFGGDPQALGRIVLLEGTGHTVVGVMPEGFVFPSAEIELWVPRPIGAGTSSGDFLRVEYLPTLVRLRQGVSPEQAATEAQAVVEEPARTVETADGDTPSGRVELRPLRDAMVAEARPALLALFAAVGLVLLIACANLANLLLARNAAREREMAIRMAVGGDRRHLIRQILVESLVLSLLGGVLGLGVAGVLHRLLPRLATLDIPRLEEVEPNLGVFLFALFLAGLTGLSFGLLPALRSARTNLVRPLHGASPRTSGGDGPRRFLVVGETALAFVLLVGAGLLVNTYLGLVRVDPGFEPDNVLTTRLETDDTAIFDELLRRLAGHPEVREAGVVSVLPPARGFSLTSFDIPDEPPARTLAVPQWTSPGFFEALGMRWIDGRGMTEDEHFRRAPVVMVNEALVRKFFGGGTAVGRNLVLGSTTLEIVGVVEDVRLLGLDAEPRPEIYASYRLAEALTGTAPSELSLAIETRGEPEALIPFLRSAVREIDPNLPLDELESLETRVSTSVARPRTYASLLGAFALLALILTAAGIFGVLADFVARRTRRIGIQRALGAQRATILQMVLGDAAVLVGLGLALGLGAAWTATKVLQNTLFGVEALDASIYALAAGVLLAVSLAACYLPARRALRVDPMVALRRE